MALVIATLLFLLRIATIPGRQKVLLCYIYRYSDNYLVFVCCCLIIQLIYIANAEDDDEREETKEVSSSSEGVGTSEVSAGNA